jgi:hypothetical protein
VKVAIASSVWPARLGRAAQKAHLRIARLLARYWSALAAPAVLPARSNWATSL